MNKNDIEKASPLYEYWRSSQTDEDEKKRLLAANFNSKAVYLFEKEPYKWECLFQSVSREIINGDNDSIRAMKILLDTVSVAEKEKIINYFINYQYFDKSILERLEGNNLKTASKKNIFRSLRILFVIFTNPYEIEIRREKKHIYEKTGSFINSIKKIIS